MAEPEIKEDATGRPLIEITKMYNGQSEYLGKFGVTARLDPTSNDPIDKEKYPASARIGVDKPGGKYLYPPDGVNLEGTQRDVTDLQCPNCGETDSFATQEDMPAVSYLVAIQSDGMYDFSGDTSTFDSETKTDPKGRPFIDCRSCGEEFVLDTAGDEAALLDRAEEVLPAYDKLTQELAAGHIPEDEVRRLVALYAR